MTRKIGFIGIFLLVLVCRAAPSQGQKSLSNGIDDLADKLATSYLLAKPLPGFFELMYKQFHPDMFPSQQEKVAVLPFRRLEGGENLFGTFMASSLASSLFNAGYHNIIERQMLDQAIKELKLQYTGMIDPASAKKVGKFLQADLVVGCTLSEMIRSVQVNCRMFSVETAQIVAAAKTEIVKDDSLRALMKKASAPPQRGTHP